MAYTMRAIRTLTPLLLLLVLVGGCARYQYDIVRPEDARQRIGKEWRRVDRGPVYFRLRTVDNHLLVHVYNASEDPIRVLGDRSYIVTPVGRSIPLPTQTIAPGAFMKLILPPVEQVIRAGPSVGFGFGYRAHGYYPWYYSPYYPYGGYGPAFYDPYWYEPRYFYIENPENYWEWEGETDVTLRVVFEQRDQVFDHMFIFHRVKI